MKFKIRLPGFRSWLMILSNCVILSYLLNLSVPWFLYLRNQGHNCSKYIRFLCGSMKLSFQSTSGCLARGENSIRGSDLLSLLSLLRLDHVRSVSSSFQEHFSYSELGYPLRKCEQLWIKMLLLECNCVFVSKLEVLYPFPSSPTTDHRFDQEMKDNHMIKGQDIFLKLKTSFLSPCRNGAG